jgi:hypothetical protein
MGGGLLVNGKRWEVDADSVIHSYSAILEKVRENPGHYWEVCKDGRVVAIMVHPDHPDLPS